MNKVHRTIWSESKGAWVVASEHAAPRGKRSSGSVSSLATAAMLVAGATGAMLSPSAVRAASVWNVSTGNWSTAANWSGGVPAAGTLTIIGNGAGVATLGASSAATGATGQLIVGHTANGALAILNGSTLTSSSNVQIGNVSGVTGTVTVDGSGSKFTSSGTVTVGDSGTGTLSVTGGAAVSGVTFVIGNSSTGKGTVTVDGSGSTVTGTGVLVVGSAGTGTLSIANGADVLTSSSIVIGNVAGSTGTVSVAGSGSTLTGTSGLVVGSAGTGSLAIGNGAAVVSGNTTTFGSSSGSTGTVTVTGSGSTLTSNGWLIMGNSGSSTLAITDGGAVKGTTVVLGASSSGKGTVTVDGSGSSLSGTGALVVGLSGTASLAVTNGADVSFGSGMQISNLAGSTGTVTVDGAGSTLAMGTGGLWVGQSGFGTLTLSNSAALTSTGTDISSSSASGGSSVTVQSGATWTDTASVTVGSDSVGHVAILTGGQASTTTLTAGNRSGGSGSTVNVDGAGSALTVSGAMIIASGGNASLAVTDGATATAGSLSIGKAATGTTTVSGAGKLISGSAVLGQTSAGTGSVTVTGSGTSWNANGTITVGEAGTGTLRVADGATASSTGGVIANASGSTGTVLITGSGSSWTDSGTLLVSNAGTGTLTVQDGATLTSGTAVIGNASTGVGTTTVTGSGSNWTANGTITVGGSGTGTLTIADGATVSSTGGVIANASGSTGTVLVTGAGSTWTDSGTLLVGNAGTGVLTIDDGGLVIAAGGTVVDAPSGVGTVNLNATSGNQGVLETLSLTRGTGTAQVNFDGGTLRAMANNASFISGFNAGELNIESGGATIDDAGFAIATDNVFTGIGGLTKIGSGTLTLNGDSTYTGGTTVSAGTLVVGDSSHSGAALSGGGATTVASGAVLGGYGSVTGTVTNNGTIAVADAIAAAGTTTGNFSIIGTLINNALAQVGGSGVGNTLTVNSYVGNNGSSLALNTYLGTDGSPSDRLIVNGGTATGNSALAITNVGGAGALTYGNGIKVVDAINGATTAAGTFSLAGAVVAGAYEYTLYRGSTDGGDAQDWYLRSTLPLGTSGSGTPNYRQEVSLYTALPSMAQTYGRMLLDSMHERVGEQEQLRGNEALDPNRKFANGAWGRVLATNGSQGNGSIYTSGPKFDYKASAAQVGLEVYREARDNGQRDHAGIYGASGHLSGDVTHANGARAGTNSFDAHTLGVYATRFGASGWYLDGVAQYTWYEDVKAQSSRVAGLSTPLKLSTTGHGWAASLEGGYPIQIGNGWIAEPQAQLTYQRINLDDSADTAAQVRFPASESLAGRVGARFARTWALDEGDKPRHMTTWLRANLWHEFMGDNKTEISSASSFVPFRSDLGGSWLEIAGGVTAQLTRNTSAFAQVGYMEGSSGRHSYNAKLGVRVNW